MCLRRPRCGPRLVSAVTTLLLVAAGCGGGAGNKSVPTTGAPVVTTVPPPGRAQLQMIVVQPGDLPAGWKPQKVTPPANPLAEATAFSQCAGTPVTAGDAAAVVFSPDYVMGTDYIASSATSFHTKNDVPADAAALTSPKAGTCLAQVDHARLAAELPAGGAVKSSSVNVTPGNAGGATNVVATATSAITFTLKGRSLTLTDNIVFLDAPRIEARIDFYSAVQPLPAATRAAIVNKVASRVAFGS